MVPADIIRFEAPSESWAGSKDETWFYNGLCHRYGNRGKRHGRRLAKKVNRKKNAGVKKERMRELSKRKKQEKTEKNRT